MLVGELPPGLPFATSACKVGFSASLTTRPPWLAGLVRNGWRDDCAALHRKWRHNVAAGGGITVQPADRLKLDVGKSGFWATTFSQIRRDVQVAVAHRGILQPMKLIQCESILAWTMMKSR